MTPDEIRDFPNHYLNSMTPDQALVVLVAELAAAVVELLQHTKTVDEFVYKLQNASPRFEKSNV